MTVDGFPPWPPPTRPVHTLHLPEETTVIGKLPDPPDLGDPVGEYRDNDGSPAWRWSCHADGGCYWLSFGHGSEAEARRSYARHLDREHAREVQR